MFTYVAIPYSDPSPFVRTERMLGFWRAVADLIQRGDHVVSPMTLEPAYQIDPTLPYDWTHWREYSLKMIRICDRVVVVKLPGWDNSIGVRGEVEEAARLQIPVEFMEPISDPASG